MVSKDLYIELSVKPDHRIMGSKTADYLYLLGLFWPWILGLIFIFFPVNLSFLSILFNPFILTGYYILYYFIVRKWKYPSRIIMDRKGVHLDWNIIKWKKIASVRCIDNSILQIKQVDDEIKEYKLEAFEEYPDILSEDTLSILSEL